MLKAQLIQVIRQSKHHVEVGHIEQVGFPFLYPFFPFVALALGAMSVAATVVAKVQPLAPWIVTPINMSPHRSSPAS
jgi:hypothetical protein